MARLTVVLLFSLFACTARSTQPPESKPSLDFLFEKPASMFVLGIHKLEHRIPTWKKKLVELMQQHTVLREYELSEDSGEVSFEDIDRTIQIYFTLLGNPVAEACRDALFATQEAVSPKIELNESVAGSDPDLWESKFRNYEFARVFLPIGVQDLDFPQDWESILVNTTNIVIIILERTSADEKATFRQGVICSIKIHGDKILFENDLVLDTE